MKRVLLTVLCAAALWGCTQSSQTSGDILKDLEQRAADSHTITKEDDGKVLVLKEGESRLEVFKTADFAPERMHGYSSSGLDEFEWKLVPKQKIEEGEYTYWLFYKKGDTKVKEALEALITQ